MKFSGVATSRRLCLPALIAFFGLLVPGAAFAAPTISRPSSGAVIDLSKVILIEVRDTPGQQMTLETIVGGGQPLCMPMTEDPARGGVYQLAVDLRDGNLGAGYANKELSLRAAPGAAPGPCPGASAGWSGQVKAGFGARPTTSPPVRGVSINAGAIYTNTPNVTLTIEQGPYFGGLPAAGELLIANDGGYAKATRIVTTPTATAFAKGATATEVPWKLQSSGAERLPKTVYVQGIGNDDIILDERPPAVVSASLLGANASAAARTFKVKVIAQDSNSGVAKAQFASNKTRPSALITYRRSMRVDGASKPKWVRVQDKAGNFSGWKKLSR